MSDDLLLLQESAETSEELVDPEELLRQVIKQGGDPTSLVLDERDIAWPANVVEGVTSSRFLDILPFGKQLQILLHLFEDYCPDCSDTPYLREIPVDASLQDILAKAELLQFGVCPKCHQNRGEFVRDGKFTRKNEFAGCVGMRGGKSAVTARMIALYQIIRFLHLSAPAKTFRLLKGQTLYCTFVAPTVTQAIETIWQHFVDQYTESPWFTQYIEFLRYHEAKRGIQLYHAPPGLSFVAFLHKRLVINYLAADIRTIRGRTRLFAAIDELGWFDQRGGQRVRANARETYQALVRSLRSVRSAASKRFEEGDFDVPDGVFANISSPSSQYDMIMQLVRGAVKAPRRYAIHYASWEFNPELTRESIIEEEGITNLDDFERDYGANPPLASGAWVSDETQVTNCFDRQGRYCAPVCQAELKRKVVDVSGTSIPYFYARAFNVINDKKTPRILTLDAGSVLNCFSVVVSRLDRATESLVAEQALCVKPHERIGVHFPSMIEECIKPLVESLNIVKIGSDRWNSLQMLQTLEQGWKTADGRQIPGVEVVSYNPSATDFDNFFANRLAGGLLRLGKPECELTKLNFDDPQHVFKHPAAHMAIQLLTVRASGIKVIKPENGDDDLFRALLQADIWVSWEPEKFYSDYVPPKVSASHLTIAYLSRSGGSRLSVSSGGGSSGQLGVVKVRRNPGSFSTSRTRNG